jgi:hypothetical protein
MIAYTSGGAGSLNESMVFVLSFYIMHFAVRLSVYLKIVLNAGAFEDQDDFLCKAIIYFSTTHSPPPNISPQPSSSLLNNRYQ